jgi:uncharacterized phage protein (TIGR01671 family)
VRQIKFRAWTGEFMLDASYGDWVSFTGIPYTEAFFKYDTPHTEIEKAKNYILMQFTGLKDKNGVEIYEGGIVKYGLWGGLCEVAWNDIMTGFFPLLSINHKPIEVIGNIHQHPELLIK